MVINHLLTGMILQVCNIFHHQKGKSSTQKSAFKGSPRRVFFFSLGRSWNPWPFLSSGLGQFLTKRLEHVTNIKWFALNILTSYCNTGQYRFVCPTFLSICEFLNPTFYSFTEISFVIFQWAICHDIHQWFFVVNFLLPFLNEVFWCVRLQHLTCMTFYQTGATYYFPSLKLAAFFASVEKMNGWKLEYWYYIYIYT